MKKLLLLIASMALFSCSDDDGSSTCTCDAVYRIGAPDPNNLHFYEGLNADCETRQPIENPTGNPEAIFLYCQEDFE